MRKLRFLFRGFPQELIAITSFVALNSAVAVCVDLASFPGHTHPRESGPVSTVCVCTHNVHVISQKSWEIVNYQGIMTSRVVTNPLTFSCHESIK